MKSCSKCGEEKTLDSFFKDKSIKCGYRARCKSCCVEDRRSYLKKYYQDNKTHLSEKNKEWRSNNVEKDRQYSRERYWRNRESEIKRVSLFHKEHKDSVNTTRKLWRQNNPLKVAAYKAKRRSNSKDNVSSKELEELFNMYDNVCLCCGSSAKLTVDHIIPLSKGGTNILDNIQPLCQSCNSSKGTKTIDYRDSKELGNG